MLPKPQSDLWDNYLAAENRGLRQERNAALKAFLGAYRELSSDVQHRWALQLASRLIDEGDELPVRMPLFRRVLLPELQSAITDREPGSARWLAGFSQHIYKCADLRDQLADESFTEHGLLLTALDHHPDDNVARRRIIELGVSRLRYTLHELPTGVLYGIDGATIDECSELLAELDDFLAHVNYLGVAAEYTDLIDKCRFHYDAYAGYLANRHGASSYAEFLAQFSDA